jgi:hypothetical protein
MSRDHNPHRDHGQSGHNHKTKPYQNGRVKAGVNMDGLSDSLKSFYEEVLQSEIGHIFTITDAKRERGAKYGSSTSAHFDGNAVDFRNDPRVFDFFVNKEEGVRLLDKYKLGIYDETDPRNMGVATGPHFHVGTDFYNSKFEYSTSKRVKELEGGELKPIKSFSALNPEFDYKAYDESWGQAKVQGVDRQTFTQSYLSNSGVVPITSQKPDVDAFALGQSLRNESQGNDEMAKKLASVEEQLKAMIDKDLKAEEQKQKMLEQDALAKEISDKENMRLSYLEQMMSLDPYVERTPTSPQQYSIQPQYNPLPESSMPQFQDGGVKVDSDETVPESNIVTTHDKVWDYKQEGDEYFTRKKGSEDWIKLQGQPLDAVRSKVSFDGTPVKVRSEVTAPSSSLSQTESKPSEGVSSITDAAKGNSLPKSTNLGGYLPSLKLNDQNRIENCVPGKGCSYNTSTKLSTLFKGLEKDFEDFKSNDLWTEDAWFNRDFQEKNGGKVVYSTDERGGPSKMKGLPKEYYDKLQVGDYVHLDRTGSSYDEKKSDKGIKNERVEHIGFIIGKDEDGTPLVWHGSEKGKAYIQRVDEDINLGEGSFSYQVASIVRNPKLVGVDKNALAKLSGTDYYKEVDQDLKLNDKASGLSGNQREAVNSVNNSIQDFIKLGFDQEDVLYAAQLLIGGVLEMESSGADWSLFDSKGDSPFSKQVKRKGKETVARLAKNTLGVGKDFSSDEASRGIYQIKPDMNFPSDSKTLKNLEALGIKKSELFSDTGNETKGALLIMLDNYSKLKKDDRFDPDRNGLEIEGNFYPSSYLLAKSWSAGPGWYNRDKYKEYLADYDVDYSNNALLAAGRINLTKESTKDVLNDLKVANEVQHSKLKSSMSEEDRGLMSERIETKSQDSLNNLEWFSARDKESTSVDLGAQRSTPFTKRVFDSDLKEKQYRHKRLFDSSEEPFSPFYPESGEDVVVKEFPRFNTSQEELEEIIQLEKQGYKAVRRGDKIFLTVKVLPGAEVVGSKGDISKFQDGGEKDPPPSDTLRRKQEIAMQHYNFGKDSTRRDASLTIPVLPDDPRFNKIWNPDMYSGLDREVMQEYKPDVIYISSDDPEGGFHFTEFKRKYTPPAPEPIPDPEQLPLRRYEPRESGAIIKGKQTSLNLHKEYNPYTGQYEVMGPSQKRELDRSKFLGKDAPEIEGQLFDATSRRELDPSNNEDLLRMFQHKYKNNQGFRQNMERILSNANL